MCTTLTQEIWRETIRHENRARDVWSKSYDDQDQGDDRYYQESPSQPQSQMASKQPSAQASRLPSPSRSRAPSNYSGSRPVTNQRNNSRPPSQRNWTGKLPPVKSPTARQPDGSSRQQSAQRRMDYHPPGYAGFVPGEQFQFAKTYAAVTRQSMGHMKNHYNSKRGNLARDESGQHLTPAYYRSN